MSLSDGNIPFTMPIQPANSSGGLGGILGGESIWIIVLFFIMIMFFGWGGNWGNSGSGGSGASPGYVLTSDFANIERKLDGINNGICDSTFALNNGLKDGFAGVTQAINSGFSAAEIARCNAQMAFMQQFNAIQQQISNCCCETREAIQGVNYNLATQACETRSTIQNGTRDILENQNANARAILDALTAQRIEAKDAKITEQSQQLFAAQLAASQAAQNDTLKAYVSGQFAYYNPRPVPSFAVPAPYQYAGCGCGC